MLIGESIRAKRLQLNLTQKQLGDILGVTPNTIARWERGELGVRNVKLLCLALEALK